MCTLYPFVKHILSKETEYICKDPCDKVPLSYCCLLEGVNKLVNALYPYDVGFTILILKLYILLASYNIMQQSNTGLIYISLSWKFIVYRYICISECD